jgi:hypothetical protein
LWQSEKEFSPVPNNEAITKGIAEWKKAIKAAQAWGEPTL